MNTPANMLPPPGTDPQTYARIMRQQMIAEALQNEALTPTQIQQPQGSNRGFYQAARVSPLSTMARVLAGVMSKGAMDKSNTAMAQMYARGLQSFDPNQPGGRAPAPPADDQSQPPPSGPPSPAQPGAAAPAQQSGGQTISPVSGGGNPLNPMGQDPRELMRLYMSDPQKYLDQIKGTPEWQTALAANGGNVQAAQNALKAELAKKGTLEMRSGGAVAIPDPSQPSGYRIVRSPNLGVGQEALYDASGNPVAVRNIPGATEAERATAAATSTGHNQGEVHTLQTQGGGSRVQFGLDGIPGAPQGPPSPQAPPRQYFPPHPGAPAAPAPAAPAPGSAAPPGSGPAPAAAGPGTPPGVTPGIWQSVPKRPNTGGLGEDPYVAGTVKKMVEKNDELSTKYGSEADLADQRIAFNNEALKVLQSANTGPMYDTFNTLKKRAIELGVPAGWLPGGDVNSTDELKKFLLRNPLLSLKPTFGGRPAASEFQVLANDASPSPQMMKAAISRLVQLDTQSAQFSKQRATDYAYYHDHLNGNPSRFESYYANKVPFASFLDQHPPGPPAKGATDTRPPLSQFSK
jgi:hypothetical protein